MQMSPDNIELIVAWALLCLSLLCMFKVYSRDLLMLQLNSYRNKRYFRWFKQSNESVNFMRLALCIALFLILVHTINFFTSGIVASLIAICCAVSLFRKKYKKPLVFTRRVMRLFATMWIVSGVAIFLPAFLQTSMLKGVYIADIITLALLVCSPVVLILANLLMSPVERHINRGYYKDAQRILRSMPNLKIIAITGSYGKTSTKHYLQRILSEKYDTLMTPGSFNTTMGVIRTIREHLKPYNEVFIVEMGAKQRGDIKEICDLVHPTMGIITAVGEQHLESFKSIENVQNTKFELADALPADGVAVVNDDFEYVANREVNNVNVIRYAINNTANANYTVKDVTLDSKGTTFTITGNGKELQLHTKLVGECNISNLMAAVIIALELGVEPRQIEFAVEKIEQVEHRLNMKRTPGGITIIDDAFNSNPTGSKMALDVLAAMKDGRRIVVTPGMIELGTKQFELNEKFGEYIGKAVDIAIIVGDYNKEAIVKGVKSTDFDESKLFTPATFAEAQRLLGGMLMPGDTVLYENDLPDTFK